METSNTDHDYDTDPLLQLCTLCETYFVGHHDEDACEDCACGEGQAY